MAKLPTFNLRSARTLTADILKLAYFQDGDPPAIPYIWLPGRTPLVMVVGENAGGKSFFRRIVQEASRKKNVECMALSMEGRHGYGAWKAFVYGDESWEATGAISASTVEVGIRTCQDRDSPHIIFWDEPDLGLSEGWAAGVGQAICEFMASPPKHTVGAFVVTHSKALAREVLPVRPNYLYLGSTKGPPTLKDWVDHRQPPRPIAELNKESHRRFKAIQKILERTKA
jgi:hypothetical protein